MLVSRGYPECNHQMAYAGYSPLDGYLAPGELEVVRRLLNTWSIPNDTRQPRDDLPDMVRDSRLWGRAFPGQPKVPPDSAAQLLQLRSCLRAMLDPAEGERAGFERWLKAIPVHLQGAPEGGKLGIRIVSSADRTFTGRIVAITAEAMLQGHWLRLKACPDCRWVFYDPTRNLSKRWCGMTKGGPGGRACGTIAKVSRFRARQRQLTR